MGRDTGKQENADYNRQMAATQAAAEQRMTAQTGKFNKGWDTLAKGGRIAANPWDDIAYNANQNILASAANSATNKSVQELMDTEARRTGSNTASRRATMADAARQSARARADATAGRKADDYGKYIAYQQSMLNSILNPTQVDASLYGSATSGRNTATKNLADIGIANQQMWSNIIGAGLTAAGAAAGACWVAAELYGGWDALPTRLVRAWLNTEFVKHPVGRAVMALYRRFGIQTASFLRRHPKAKLLFQPVFDSALNKALAWKMEG